MCKIIKAEMARDDLHIQCECMEERVYGTDKVYSPHAAMKAFKAEHKALTQKVTATAMSKVIGSSLP